MTAPAASDEAPVAGPPTSDEVPKAAPLATERAPGAAPPASAPVPPWRLVAPATWAVVLALGAVWAVWQVWARLTGGPAGAGWGPLDSVLRASAAAQIGKPAPVFALADPDGVTYRLDDLHGQVVLVNFWATWCEPCRAEMPELDALAREYREDGFRVLAVNVLEDAPEIRQFGAELDLDLPLLADRRGDTYKAYNVQALPSSYLVDRDGVIRDVRLGVVTRRYLESRLPALLTYPPNPPPFDGRGNTGG